MARNEDPPFARGQTFYNGATIITTDLGGQNLEGKEWEFEDIDLSQTGAKPARTNRTVRCRCVRNVSGISLLPKRIVTYQSAGTDGRYDVGRVDGYSTTVAARAAGVVDEWLSSTGVVNNDLFWIVVSGPTKVLTDLAGGANNVVSIGGLVTALTAATSQATTAGRVQPQDLTGATALLGNQIQNVIGKALSAVTTANTNADLLVDMADLL